MRVNSLTLRLVALIAIGLLFVASLGMLAVNWVIDRHLDSLSKQALLEEIGVVQNILTHYNDDASVFNQEIVWEPQITHDQYLIRIKDSSGQNIDMTRHFIQQFPDEKVWPTSISGVSEIREVAIGNRSYLLATDSMTLSPDKQYVINVAYDTSENTALLHKINRDLLLILAVLLSASGAIVYSMVKVGLRPLAQLVSQVKTMDINRLQHAIHLPDAPLELQTLVNTFNELMTRLAESYQQLADFSSNLAHELRTPINNLMVETDLALSRHLESRELQPLLESNLEEYRKLANIIEKLLFLARADAKNYPLLSTSLYLRDIIESVVDFYLALATEQNIALTVEGNASVTADQTLFRQALGNVISNAIKYAGTGSKIWISVTEQTDRVLVQVIDNGKGVPTEHLPYLANRFYRSEKMDSQGLGMGLSIVATIMQLHGGRLMIAANQPTGLAVSLLFPKSK